MLEQLESRRVLSISGDVVTDDIYPRADVDYYYFTVDSLELAAVDGEYVVTVALAAGYAGFQPQARLFYRPTGDLIGGEIDAGSSRKTTLRDAGEYGIRIHDDDDRDTGTYALALEGISPPSLDAQALALGELRTSVLSVPGDVDEYTFTASAGNVVTLSLSESHPGSRAILYSPRGENVKLYSDLTGNRVTELTAGHKVLTEPLAAGKHVLQVYDNNYLDTGTYELSLEGLVPASTDATSVTLGDFKTGEIVAGEVDAYRFSGTAGDIVTLSLSDAQAGSDTALWAALYSPSGKKVPKLPGTNGPDEVENGKKVFYRLPAETGTYVIQVFDYDYTHAEQYGVALEGLSTPSSDAIAIAVGQQKTGTIDGMGEVDEFYFTLTATDLASSGGQYQVRLSFASEDTVDYKPRAALYAPSGLGVGREASPGDADVLTLTQAGSYVIQVYDNDYTQSKAELINRGKDPAYTLQLQDAQPPVVQGVTVSDTLVADADTGPAKFAVTVVFNETMNTASLPTLLYSNPAVTGGATPTLSNPSFRWSTTAVTNDTVTVTYDVADRQLAATSITIDVLGAKDVAGNLMQDYMPEAEFSIDTRNPSVSALTPLDNATRVPLNTNLVMVFDEPVQAGSGLVTLKKSSDGATVEIIPVSGSQVTISGATATIGLTDPLGESTGYYVEVAVGAFLDLAGNAFAGISGGAVWNFTSADLTPPSVAALSPPDDATGVAADANLTITFNEPVRAGAGSVTIKRSGDGSTIETIAVPSERVIVAGSAVTMDPAVTLADNTAYYVEVTEGAFEDLAGNRFSGITGAAAWNFTSADLPPVLLQLSPADDAAGVNQDANLIVTFDQAIQKNAGDIVVKRSSDGLTVLTIPVTSDEVTVVGAVATIDPGAVLERRESYYIEIAAGTFLDLTGNPFAGISGPTAWNFTTVGPLAVNDSVTTKEDAPLDMDVLGNDSGNGRPYDPTTLAIVAGSGPAFGNAAVIHGLVSYTPGVNFSGIDSFRYTFHDVVGFVSNEGLVTIAVTEVPDYQNPDLPEDVNRSGTVTPLDVLTAINRINGHGSQLPPDPIPPALPIYYYDVDGNNLLEPRDLLIIINYLNRQPWSAGGEGEATALAAGRWSTPSPPALNSSPAGFSAAGLGGVNRAAKQLGAGSSSRDGTHRAAMGSEGLVQSWRHDQAWADLGNEADQPLDELLSLLAADVADAGR